MSNGMIIAVSGIMGSGKTTLCRGLARKMGWSCLPEPEIAKKYLPDFFQDLDRYAYPTQMAFLCNKAVQIIQILQAGRNLILDRSLYEDVYIFAKCWHDRGNIENRDFSIYSELADFFLEQIPNPQLILYCQCSLNEAKKRMTKRDRMDQRNFPENHVENIEARYRDWISNYKGSPTYSVNTERYDVRTDKVIAQILQEVLEIGSGQQLTLFDDAANHIKFSDAILEPINNQEAFNSNYEVTSITPERTVDLDNLMRPWAYLAAPFTSVATEEVLQSDQSTLVDMSPLHGKIKPGEYRRMLQAVARRLKGLHIDTLIPHRDINEWGDKTLTPEDAASNCAASVKSCDLFIGILGESSGSHYEFGIAEGRSKPSVIIICDEIKTSFIGSGLVSNDADRLILKCAKITEIASLFSGEDFLSFIRRNGF